MFRKLLSILGFTAAALASSASAAHDPYQQPEANTIYNLLFCDEPSLFAAREGETPTPWQSTLFDTQAQPEQVRAIAENASEESRIRALAYHWLREHKAPVTAGVVLGVIVEVPLDDGLDVLAAYSDGRVRYINQSGKIAIFEGGAPQVEALAKDLVSASTAAVRQIGPWEADRLAPPAKGDLRITFLVSDGLYFGEGPFEAMQSDPMAGPIVQKATQLLLAVVETSTE